MAFSSGMLRINFISADHSGLSKPSKLTCRAPFRSSALASKSLSQVPPQIALSTPPIVQGLPEAYSSSKKRLALALFNSPLSMRSHLRARCGSSSARRRHGASGMQFGSKSFGPVYNGPVDGFGNGIEHAQENPLMEWIEPVPVEHAEYAFG